MSAVLNDRDAILQAAATRIVNPKNADIMLDMSAPAFHVNAEGIADVASITITGMLVGLEGALSWSVQGATLSNVTERSATVTYASMQGATAIVTASMTSSGELFSRSRVLATMQDGLSGANAKTVRLTASEQVFKISKAGANSPASITLTAVGQNTAGVPSFTIPVGTATLSAGSSASQKVLTFANMTTDQVTVEVTLDGQKDRVTIYKVREGQDGQPGQPGVDAIVGLLTNESVTLPAGSNGVVSSFSSAVCTMVMYKGAADDSANWTYAFSPASASNRLSYTTSGSTVTLTGMAAGVDSSYVDITASKAGSASVTKRFFVAKSKAGASVTGARGAGQYYVVGSAWSDVVAQAACPGGPVVNDQVTISNGTVTYTKRWDGAAWNVPGAYLSDDLFVEGGIHGSKLKVGTVEVRKPDGTLLLGAGGEFGATVKVSNLEVSGSSDNIIPDPRFKDLAWWGRVGSAVGQFAEEGMVTDWKGGASLYLSKNAGELISYGQFFDLAPGATYRMEIQVALSNDFNGRASVYLTIPGDRDYAMVDRDSGLRWSDNMVVQLTSNSPKGVISYSTTYTIPANGTLSKGRIQIRNSHTVGNVEVGSVSITRMADANLVVNGAVTAEKIAAKAVKASNIDVDTLAAIIAYLGNVELGAGGALRQGKPGYGVGKGIWIGDHNGTPKLDIGETGGAGIIWEGFDLIINRPKLASPFSVTLSNVRLTQQVNGSTIQFSAPKTITSGSGNYAYSWSFSSQGVSSQLAMISSPAAQDAVIKANASNSWLYGYLALTLKDLNSGLTATSNCEIVVQFGSGVEP